MRAQKTFDSEVLAVIPQSAEFMGFDEDVPFVLRHPQHPVSLALQQVALALTARRVCAPRGPPKAAGVSPFAGIRHLLHEAAWVYLRPYWKLHALIAVGVVVGVLFEAGFPLTIRFLIDEALLPHDPDKLICALAAPGAAVRRSGGQPLRAGGRARAHLPGAVLGPEHRHLPLAAATAADLLRPRASRRISRRSSTPNC